MKVGSEDSFGINLRWWVKLGFIVCLIFALVLTGPSSAISVGISQNATEGSADPSHSCGSIQALNSSQKRCLMTAYAPILHFPLEEQYRPTSVVDFIERAEVDEGPTHLQEPASLDTIGSREADSQLIVEGSVDFTNYGEDALPRIVYAHVTETEHEYRTYIAITYWMFYFHDPKKAGSKIFAHQSDFESVTILINESGAQYIAGSQHFGGERRQWKSIDVTEGTHPHVYPALGSHSIYFTNTEEFESDIISQKHHIDDESDSPAPVMEMVVNPLYVDKTGNHTIWTHGRSDWNSEQYDLQLLTGNEEWQSYRGSFTQSLTRAVLDRKSPAPKYRHRWDDPGGWMESLVSYSDLVNPQIGWGWLNLPSNRGTLSDSTVTVTPKVWNQKSVLPARLYVEVIVKGQDGKVIGRNSTVVKRQSGKVVRFSQPRAEIKVPLEGEYDSVSVEVRVYRKPHTQSEESVASTTGTICKGVLCGIL